MKYDSIRLDYRIIIDLVCAHASVLDLGCGNGELLFCLIKEKNVRGVGIEIDEQAIYKCVAKGLNVIHADIDTGLSEYSDKSFDYVILNQSLQQVKHLEPVFRDALRVGKEVIVGFPNFAHYSSRFQIFFQGRTPKTASLPYNWHETPNLHFLSILDFIKYCKNRKIKIKNSIFIGKDKIVGLFPNLLALTGIFLISER